MANYGRYVVKETTTNLWRNRLTTIAAILTVFVSLALVGFSLVVKQGVSNAQVKWQQGTEVRVWMQPTATTQQVASVGAQLHQLSYVSNCRYNTQAQDYAEAKRLLSPILFAQIQPHNVPSRWSCVPDRIDDALAVAAHFSGVPGVKSVTSPTAALRNQQKFFNILQWVLLIIAIVLLISAVVLILNTIRMAIFARRREVSVMKLVGATNWFIRIPFIFEGLVQGLIGSIFAGLSVWTVNWFMHHWGSQQQQDSVLNQMLLSTSDVIIVELVVVLLGIAIGSIGSAIAIRRFLDV